MEVTGRNFTEVYGKLANALIKYRYLPSPRGSESRELLGVNFEIEDPLDRLPRIQSRNFNLAYCIAEIIWYLSGSNSVKWIARYSPFWLGVSDDGVTANSAYGSRIFRQNDALGFDIVQWETVKQHLIDDPFTRRAVIHIKTPADNDPSSKDIPCTLDLQFILREGRLNMFVNMRSSDLIFGIGNDIPAFTFFQELMANELGVEVGTYSHKSNSLHVYPRHYEMVSSIVNELDAEIPTFVRMPKLPRGDVPIVDLVKAADGLERRDISPDEVKAIVDYFSILPYFRDWVSILTLRTIKSRLNNLSVIIGADEMRADFMSLQEDLIKSLHTAYRWYYA
jgi:thymidylate synthase